MAEILTLDGARKQAGPAKVLVLAPLLEQFPAIIARCDVEKLTGGLVSQKTLALHDSEGTGPRVRLKFKQKIAYPRDYFVEYLEAQKVMVVASPAL